MAKQKNKLKRFLELYDYVQKAEEIILKKSNLTEEQAYHRLCDIVFTNGIYAEMRGCCAFTYEYPSKDSSYKAIYSIWKGSLEKTATEIKKQLEA